MFGVVNLFKICFNAGKTFWKNILKRPRKEQVLCTVFGCFVVYIVIQLGTLLGLRQVRLVEQLRGDPASPSYLSFLVSIISQKASNFNLDCISQLQENRTFMSHVETNMRNQNTNPKFVEFLKNAFSKCVIPGDHDAAVSSESGTVTTSTLASTLNYHSKPCLLDVNYLKGEVALNVSGVPPTFQDISAKYSLLKTGGHYEGPKYCRPRYSVAVIIPYRDRDAHLRFWLYYTLETLMKQQIQFNVFVAEQEGDGVFNKGQLMNTAFTWITSNMKGVFQCFVFHDVDMIPENAANIYKCSGMRNIMHLSPIVSKFNYTTKNVGVTVGGAVSFNEWQFRAVNGYSNVYWGWGGEDDDMNLRIRLLGFRRVRPSFAIGRYKMIQHLHDQLNPLNKERHALLKKTRATLFTDGLSNLNTTVTKVTLQRSHTNLLIRVSKYIRPESFYQTTPAS